MQYNITFHHPPTTRQPRSADRPAPVLFILRPTLDGKHLRIVLPAKPLDIIVDVADMLRCQAEDYYEYDCA